MKIVGLIVATLFAGQACLAQDQVVHEYNGTFDDATFAVESAIVDKGLVVDYVSHVGAMLNRTGSDVGSDKPIFKGADAFLFCSAVLSREVMEADPLNIAQCPYSVFVFEDANGVKVGYRKYPEGIMQKVQELLASIVQAALQQ